MLHQPFALPKPGKPENPLRQHHVKVWQEDVKKLFGKMGIDCPIKADGIFTPLTRAFTADLVRASGLSLSRHMPNAEVSVELRNLLRTGDFEKVNTSEVLLYREMLKDRWALDRRIRIHKLTPTIISDAWGWKPGIHDGVDVYTMPRAVLFSMVRCFVVAVQHQGWMNLGSPDDPPRKVDGDGLVLMEVIENVGPFRAGMHLGYGNVGRIAVNLDQEVEAGQLIAYSGSPDAWHVHLLVSTVKDLRGIGNQDPRPLLEHATVYG